MTRTPELIDTLVECATPVRRLRPPLMRAAIWRTWAAREARQSSAEMGYVRSPGEQGLC